MTLELTDEGLQTQTQAEAAEELSALIKASPVYGPNTNLSINEPLGQLVAILSELDAARQQALLAVYRSMDPNGATGRALDARVALTGTTRLGATSSTVTGILTFSSAGTMNTGDLIENEDNETQWALVDGPKVSTGPWPETFAATFEAVDTGPILADSGTTWGTVTVVAGLDGFTNASDDAEPGRDAESDADLRKRRLTELYSQGQGPLAAIQGAVSQVDGVVSCRVYHNPTTMPGDSNGIPFKAFNVVVETSPASPGADLRQEIADTIWAAMGAGGRAYGTDHTETVVDSEGQNQSVSFDVVDVADIVLQIDLVTSTSEDAVTANLDALVLERVLEVAQADYEVAGRDVRRVDFQGIVQAMQAAGEISGVDDVTVRMSISPGAPAAVAKLSIGIRQKPDFDSGNITIAQV